MRALSALQMRGSSVVARRAQRQAWNRMILLRFSASSMFIRTDYFSEPIILMELNGKKILLGHKTRMITVEQTHDVKEAVKTGM